MCFMFTVYRLQLSHKSLYLKMNPNENPQWQYKPGGQQPVSPDQVPQPAGISPAPTSSVPAGSVVWTAAEYIEHDRSSGWYMALVAGTAVLTAIVYFITKDYLAAGVIPVLGFIVGFSAGHKPRQLEYELSDSGLRIGTKNYPYDQFKSFSLIPEGELNSINLLPVKRFMPMISAYFAPGDQERIAASLGNHLPFEQRQMDGVDRLSRHLRF
jgi:hypothetical protein